MATIKIEPLTSNGFAPYGRVLDFDSSNPTKSGEGWTCYSPVDFLQPTSPMLGIGMVISEKYPKEVTALERHVSREELLWAAREDLVMFVDIPYKLGSESQKPNIYTTKAFLIKAGQAVIMHRGTWHSPAFALEGTATYYFAIEFTKDFIDQDEQPWIPFNENEVAVLVE
ncbi:hypothetical protein D1B31_21080 [Neobacillus notoginsengisoli]|uniref:Ureidoglycolate hydrolase n=1 Tax=Neobacillus notoginsengisoli TaxID=1578198 RepID=A0A417YIK6_9BACI|nr:ureidoglycolate lyase [Neobacillus notoginsengisoli]RHW32841.1 hypothetical protein D1B31_21080 [Neobacillus notoginsengisoli]